MEKLIALVTALVRRFRDIARAEWRNVVVIIASTTRTVETTAVPTI